MPVNTLLFDQKLPVESLTLTCIGNVTCPALFGLLVVLGLQWAVGGLQSSCGNNFPARPYQQLDCKYKMRQLTFCQLNEAAAGFDQMLGEDELWYVEPYYYKAHQRLPKFATEWKLKPSLPSDAYYSIGTCFYNLPRAVIGEKNPPVTIAHPRSVLYPQRQVRLGVQNTLICFVTDFHPAPVKISWTRNEEPVSETLVRQTQYYSNPDYSFRTFSYLDFTPELGDIYSCTVRHQGLQDPLTRFWELELETDSQVMETTVCVLGVTLGILGMAVGIWLIIRVHLCGQSNSVNAEEQN